MKKLSALLISVLLSASMFTSVAQKQQNPYMTRSFAASSIKSLEVTTSGGYITVNSNANSEAVVEVFVSRGGWSAEKIKKTFEENYDLDVKVEAEKLSVVAKPKNKITNWSKQGVDISFKIMAPKQVNSNLRTSGGSISLENLSGSQNFATSGGSLSVENVSDKIVGATSGGSITIKNSNGNIDLKTSGGSIAAKNCDGKIDIATAGGSLTLSNLKGNINAKTSGGSISAKTCDGTIHVATSGGSINLDDISGNVSAATSGGSMHVIMKSVNDYVKLSNTGYINLTVPAAEGYNLKVGAGKINTSGLKGFNGNMENSSLNGTVGNGGAKIEVQTTLQVSLVFK